MHAVHDPGGLTPAQQRALALLRRPVEAPEPVGDLAERVRGLLEDGLGPLVDVVDPTRALWVSKHALSGLHSCEAAWLATRDTFSWSVRSARGTVVHKAIELSVHWRGEPLPGVLVDEAVERLADADTTLAGFLGRLRESERAELTSMCVDLVAKFQECFPPLRPAFRPVTESRVRAELCEHRVVLAGAVDLSLGRAEGERPGKVLVDFKTGSVTTQHREDLRFYAVIETVRVGVPPRLVATLELDTGTVHHEVVTLAVLEAAARRVVDAVRRMAELVELGAEPLRRPGPRCRWCPLADTCEPGRTWLAHPDGPS